MRDLLGLIRALRHTRPDVVIPYTTWPNIGINLAARFVPNIVTVWGQRDIVSLKNGFFERMAWKRANAVICNAEHEVGFLQRVFGDTRKNIHVVYNGVQLPEPELSRSEWRSKLNIKECDAVVVMLANFRKEKGHELLLQAWRQVVKSAKSTPVLVLAGAHQQNYENIHQLACQFDLESSVRFPGHVQDVSGLLRASDIGVLVSPAEGLPNAVLEYMAAGLPVSASDVAGIREALGAETAGVFDGASGADVAEKLLHWINSPEDAKRSGLCNMHRIAEKFLPERMCCEMEEIIQRTLFVRSDSSLSAEQC